MSRDGAPWERLDGETELCYSRFRAFLATAPPRARKPIADMLGIKRHALDVAASRWKWVERARAYDDEMAAASDRAALAGAEDMQKRHLGLMQEMLKRGLELIREGDGDARAGAKMVTEGVRLERLITGEATSRTESQVSTIDRDPDLSRLTDEEREEWLAGLEDDTVVRWLELDDKARGRESTR